MIFNAIILDRVGAPPLATGLVSLVIAGSAFMLAQKAMWAGGFSESRETLRPAILSALAYFVLLALAEWAARTLDLPALYWVEVGLSIIVFYGLYKSFQA